MSHWNIQGDFEALIIWNGRNALLGAAYLLCPEPFEELAKVLPNVPSPFLEAVARLRWRCLEVRELAELLEQEGRFWIVHPALQAFELWRRELWFRRNCAKDAAFPESWRPWAYPTLAFGAMSLAKTGTYLLGEGETLDDPHTWAHYLFGGLVMAFKGGIISLRVGPEPGEEEGIHPRPRESMREFLDRARRYYVQVMAKYQARQIPNAYPPTWRTQQRDLLLYAMHHLLGLSYEKTAEKAEEMRHQGGELSRYLNQGRRAPDLAEEEAEAPYAVLGQGEVAKAIARVNKHLRLS